MSWKSVELQVALPRSQDAGKLQEQMSRQNQRFQESLAESQLKQEEQKRKKVNEFDELTKAAIRDEDANKKKDLSEKKQDKDQSSDEEEHLGHPYLGNRVDFTR